MRSLIGETDAVKNPWKALPAEPPYVLSDDAVDLEAFSQSASDDMHIHTELLPEPFLGRPDASVVLLNLNPGFSPDDPATHLRREFILESRRNLAHDGSEFPFFFLHPQLGAPG